MARWNKNHGSSPRVRGKRLPELAALVQERLIPARAGKTHKRGRNGNTDQAHPRACGENSTYAFPGRIEKGSSPRVRGKPSKCRNQEYHPRLIPARAGKTPNSAQRGI